MLIAAKSYTVLMQSATPAHTPRQLKAIGYIAGLHDLYNFNAWSKEYGCLKIPRRAWSAHAPLWNMQKINKILFPDHGAKMSIKDIKNFPANTICAKSYEIEKTNKLNNAYKDMVRQAAAVTKNKNSAQALKKYMEYRQLAEKLKMQLFIDLTNDYIEKGRSIVIFINFTRSRETLYNNIKSCVQIYGDQSVQDREDAISLFQADKCRVMIAQIQAGGVGLSLHDLRGEFPRIALVSPTNNPYDLKQCLGRINRAGAKSPAFQYIIYAAKTIETEICEKVNAKLDNIAGLTDGDLMEPDLLFLKNEVKK
jgi:SNF2 family DNA or RNA helicase